MMRVIDFDIYEKSEEELTQELILANATYDIKKVLSDETPSDYNAVSVLTTTQAVNCAFYYELFDCLHHANITDLMLSRIYPNYQRKVSEGIYRKYNSNNIFVLITDILVIICARSDIIITEKQFNSLVDMLHNISESDFRYLSKPICLDYFDEYADQFFDIDEIDEIIDYFKSKVSKIKPVEQYSFSSYDFSSCMTQDEILALSSKYAKHHFDNRNLINSYEGR